MLAFIFENNFDACKYPTRSFPSSSLLFFFPWSYPLYLQPYLSINTPPRYLYLPSLPHSYIIVIIDKLVVELVERGGGVISDYSINSRVFCVIISDYIKIEFNIKRSSILEVINFLS